MIKVYTNQPITLKAKLSDPEPAKLVELKTIDIVNRNGDVIKSINAEKETDEWLTTFVFPKTTEPGVYEARWTFSFNGEDFFKVDYLDVSNKIELVTEINPKIEELVKRDQTLPEEVEELLRSYIK